MDECYTLHIFSLHLCVFMYVRVFFSSLSLSLSRFHLLVNKERLGDESVMIRASAIPVALSVALAEWDVRHKCVCLIERKMASAAKRSGGERANKQHILRVQLLMSMFISTRRANGISNTAGVPW